MRIQLDTCHGYTVLETLISASIGTLVIVGIMVGLSGGTVIGIDNRSQLYAVNAIREEIETLRRTNFDTIVGYGASTAFTNSQLAKIQSGSGTRAISSGFGADIKKVTLSVSWTSRDGRTKAEEVTTYLTRKGLNGS